MDKVTRPSWAARRASSLRSASIDAGETSDDSLPSSAKGSDEESKDSEVEILPARTPDPRATRHSKRAEAKKTVDYSRNHHPQDRSLPGYQHKARLLRRAKKRARKQSLSERQSSPQPDDGQEENVALYSEDEAGDDLEQAIDELRGKAPSKPRKRLCVLSDDRSSSPQKSKNTKQPSTPASEIERSVSRSEDTPIEDAGVYEDDITGAIEDQQATSSDDAGAAQELNGVVDAAQDISSSERGLSDMLAAKEDRPIAGLNMLGSDDGNHVVVDNDDNDDDDRDDDHDDDSDESSQGSDADEDSEVVGDADDEHYRTHDGSNKLSTNEYGSSTMFQQESVASTSTQCHPLPLWKREQGGSGELDEASGSIQGPTQRQTTVRTDAGRGASSLSTLKTSVRVESSSSTFKASSRVSSWAELQHHHSDPGLQKESPSHTQTAQHKTLEVKTPGSLAKASVSATQVGANIDKGPSTAASILASRHATFETYPALETGSAEAAVVDLARSKAIAKPEAVIDSGRAATAQEQDGEDGRQTSPLTSPEDGHASITTSESSQSSRAQDFEPDGQSMRAPNGPSQMVRESSRMSLQSPEPTPERPVHRTLPTQASRKDKLLSSDPTGGPTMMEAPRSDHTEFTNPSSPSKHLQVFGESDDE